MKKRNWLILFVFVIALTAAACGGEPPSACVPAPELCDGLDNDCDGQTDEDFPLGRECAVGVGECKRNGRLICAPDKSSTVCDAAPGVSSEEICDGKDNNCDGATDEEPSASLSCDDGISCTHDNCFYGQCARITDDPLCDDQNVCNGIEKCDLTLGCVAGTALQCDDGVWCNGQETCDPIQGCRPGIAPTLSDDISCTVDYCDEVNDKIVHMPVNSLCDDGFWCNGDEWCDMNNGCQSGTAPVLSDGIECTVDSCDEVNDKIVHTPNNAACSDNNVCNGIEMCDSVLGCVVGIPLQCDDGNVCNGIETCDAILGCQPGIPLQCDDGNICNGIETCDPVNGCQSGTPLQCNDGLFCNGQETCDPIQGCKAGVPPALSDGIACTDDTCDEVNDKIVHTPNNAFCDDGKWCNGQEICDTVNGCQAGTPPTLSDNIPCTIDTCDEVNDKIVHTPNNAACSDNNVCNGLETCHPTLGCQLGVPLICDDGLFCNGQEICNTIQGCKAGTAPNCASLTDQCNTGVCDEGTVQCKKQPTNEDQSCDDHSICTSVSKCQNGICVGVADKDSDGDGYIDQGCGGNDCDDNDQFVQPDSNVAENFVLEKQNILSSDWLSSFSGGCEGVWIYDVINIGNAWYVLFNVVKVYSGVKYHNLSIANNSSGFWVVEKRIEGSDQKHARFTMDSNGKIHILMSIGSSGWSKIRYMHNLSGSWSMIDLTPNINIDINDVAGISASGEKVFMFFSDGYVIKRAIFSAGIKLEETALSRVETWGYCFNHDASGLPHAVFLTYDNKFQYQTYKNGGWITEFVQSEPVLSTGERCSLSVDENGRIHLVAVQSSQAIWKYHQKKLTGEWISEILPSTLASCDNTQPHTCIFTFKGVIHVSGQTQLLYAIHLFTTKGIMLSQGRTAFRQEGDADWKGGNILSYVPANCFFGRLLFLNNRIHWFEIYQTWGSYYESPGNMIKITRILQTHDGIDSNCDGRDEP